MKAQLCEPQPVRDYPPHLSVLQTQLVREITCLERQMERARELDAPDENMMQTFESMIENRRRMLNNMPWSE